MKIKIFNKVKLKIKMKLRIVLFIMCIIPTLFLELTTVNIMFCILCGAIGAKILIKDIVKPIIKISSSLNDADKLNCKVDIPKEYTNREDEIGSLAKNIENINNKLMKNFEYINIQSDLLEKEKSKRKTMECNFLLSSKIIDNAKEAFIILDNNKKIIYVNKAFTKITGYKNEEMINQNIYDVIKINPQLRYEIHKSVEKNAYWAGEMYNMKKNTEKYPMIISVRSVKNDIYPGVNYIIIFEDISKRKADEEKIKYLKEYDILTKFPKKQGFVKNLERSIKKAKEDNRAIAVMILGLDDFKFINKAIGHVLGDDVLVKVSKRLNHYTDKEFMGRITGDEFGIILNNIESMEKTIAKANELLNIFQEPVIIGDKEIYITASIGISIYPIDGENAETLMTNAMSAQSSVKNSGKNNYEIYSKKINQDAYKELEMITYLRHAIEREEFVLHYQPQIDLDTNKVIGVEALVRWNHPKLGLIYPDKFIPLAEKTGLIIPISKWVTRKACIQNKKFHDMGYNHFVVAVNLSGVQFRKGDLAKEIKNILKETNLQPKYLEIEITEGILIENIEQAIEILLELKEIGVSIAIDDFGTGYSSLSYLKEFPIDRLKIDRSFIKGIPKEDDGVIASIIIKLARSLKLKVIAEGVETKEQLNFLDLRMCNEIQGYYFSKPLNESDIEKFLKIKKNSV